eukprot:8187042-Ditylum_brightwellii.AAC.1
MDINTAKNIAVWDDVGDSNENCNLVSNEPDDLFKNGSLMNHRFINKVENSKRLVGVDESTFVAWQKEVISAFNHCNEFALTGDVEGFEEIGVKPFAKV